jgi:hypothetical protein
MMQWSLLRLFPSFRDPQASGTPLGDAIRKVSRTAAAPAE